MKKWIIAAGTRPNFIKIAPLLKEIKKYEEITSVLVHTGQHFDDKMSKVFFEELELSKPDINLNVSMAPSVIQIAEIRSGFETVILKEKPDLVIVVGDVSSTVACALSAAKLGIKLAHIESGLRSFDNSMPEEENRILTDSVSDFLFVSDPEGVKNLKNEGINENKIFYVGNIMIDTLLDNSEKILKNNMFKKKDLIKNKYAVLTLHRPSNVDNVETLKNIMNVLEEISKDIKIVFPCHPRTIKKMNEFGVLLRGVRIVSPLGYLGFMNLVMNSRFVLTDSGGIQEETTFLGVPCLTLRENTERPITITKGSNKIVGKNFKKLKNEINRILNNKNNKVQVKKIKFWDGNTSQRIVKILASKVF